MQHVTMRFRIHDAKRTLNCGFTLIEILVAISIVGLLFGLGYAAYREFTFRQSLENTHKELGVNFELVRQLALSGEKPAGCSGALKGYRVSFESVVYRVYAACDSDILVRTILLAPGVEFVSYTNNVLFKVLGQGTDLPPESLGTYTIKHRTDREADRLVAGRLTKEGIFERIR